MFRVLTLIFTKYERLLVGAQLSANAFDDVPSDVTLRTYTRTIAEKFLHPETMIIESHVVKEGSYVNIFPEVVNV